MATDKITEEELVTRIRGEITNSLGYMGDTISQQREQAMSYYYGLPFGNEVEGRSQFVDTTVADFGITYVTLLEADLELDKSIDNTNPNVGDDVTFTIALTNQGPDTATNVEVSDSLPTGLTYVSDDSGGAYEASTGIWDVGSLPSGDTVTLAMLAISRTDRNRTTVSSIRSRALKA